MKKIKEKKNVVIYARTATDNVAAIEKQNEELYYHALSRGRNILKYVSDTGSGVQSERFENMLKQFVELKPDFIMAVSVDRFTKEYNQLKKMIDVCIANRIQVEVLIPTFPCIDDKEKFDFFLSLMKAANENTKNGSKDIAISATSKGKLKTKKNVK